jgi:hypothetical protein
MGGQKEHLEKSRIQATHVQEALGKCGQSETGQMGEEGVWEQAGQGPGV